MALNIFEKPLTFLLMLILFIYHSNIISVSLNIMQCLKDFGHKVNQRLTEQSFRTQAFYIFYINEFKLILVVGINELSSLINK